MYDLPGIAYVALPLSLQILLNLTSPAIGKPATLISPMTLCHWLFMYATCMIVNFVKLQVAVSVSWNSTERNRHDSVPLRLAPSRLKLFERRSRRNERRSREETTCLACMNSNLIRWLNRVMQDHEARASDLNRKFIFSFFLLFS